MASWCMRTHHLNTTLSSLTKNPWNSLIIFNQHGKGHLPSISLRYGIRHPLWQALASLVQLKREGVDQAKCHRHWLKFSHRGFWHLMLISVTFKLLDDDYSAVVAVQYAARSGIWSHGILARKVIKKLGHARFHLRVNQDFTSSRLVDQPYTAYQPLRDLSINFQPLNLTV